MEFLGFWVMHKGIIPLEKNKIKNQYRSYPLTRYFPEENE